MHDQPWMTGDGMDPLRRSFGIDEYIAQARKNGIAASVVVQTVADISETEELLDLVAATSQVTGVVGWVDLAATDVGAQLDRLLQRSILHTRTAVQLLGDSIHEQTPDPAELIGGSRNRCDAGRHGVTHRNFYRSFLEVNKEGKGSFEDD